MAVFTADRRTPTRNNVFDLRGGTSRQGIWLELIYWYGDLLFDVNIPPPRIPLQHGRERSFGSSHDTMLLLNVGNPSAGGQKW